MPAHLNESRDIRPAAPDPLVRELLALSRAQVLPLAPGDSRAFSCAPDDFLLAAAVQGSLSVSDQEHYTLLSQGQVLAFHPEGAFTLQSVSDSLCMTVTLRGEMVLRLLQDQLEEGGALFSTGAASVRSAVMALSVLEESGAVSGDLASSYAYSLLMELRISLRSRTSGQGGLSPLVESALAIIQEEFPYLEGLDELSQRLEVSKAHLIRTFTKATGISPGKYITRVRVEYAKLLLREEDSSVTYAAEASGFANANYFAKVFRRETGMSPSEFLESTPRTRERVKHPESAPSLW